MAEALTTESTASLMTTTRNWIKIDFNKQQGVRKHRTKIHNKSERTIFLIPIFCATTADLSSGGIVENKLAESIPAGETIKVDSEKYNQTVINPGFQIHILFRAGNTDDKDEFIKNFCNEGIKVENVETLLHHGQLSGHDLELTYEEGKATVDGNTVQGKKEEDTLETLVDLIKKVSAKQKGLEEDIKALLKEMKILKEAWKGFDQKQHELHRAKPDPSFFTNTPSLSK